MILTCPSCATRYQADAAKFPADGRQVRCAKCGAVWHQAAPAAEPAGPDGVEEAVPASHPQDLSQAPLAARSSAVPAVREAPGGPRWAWLPRLGIAAGWAGLIAAVLLIGLSAVRYRQEITVAWPQSAGVYNSLGLKVGSGGITFIHVAYHRESEDGRLVLVVTGRIVNQGGRELPVPQTIRLSLSDADNHELYHWPLTPGARTLAPGQSVAFLTRLSSPPAAARHLELRFASDAR